MKSLLYILMAFLMLGCGGSDRPSKPDDLIPADQMSAIIYDVFLLNAAKGVNKRTLERKGIFPQEYVFKKYKIDSLQFAQSNDYYAYDTKTYEEIMARVKQKLEYEKKINDSLTERDEKRRDSIRLANIADNDTIKKLKIKAPEKDTLLEVNSQIRSKIFGQGDDD